MEGSGPGCLPPPGETLEQNCVVQEHLELWRPVLPAFEERFTVCAVDRRGRGGSGDSDDYAIEREFEDVTAVVDSLGEPVNLLGHSYGALCALEAARLTRNVDKLVLYDPGIEVAGQEIYPQEVIERLETLLEAGDRDGVVATTMREVAGLPPETVEYTRSRFPRDRVRRVQARLPRGNCERSKSTRSIQSGLGSSRCRRCC